MTTNGTQITVYCWNIILYEKKEITSQISIFKFDLLLHFLHHKKEQKLKLHRVYHENIILNGKTEEEKTSQISIFRFYSPHYIFFHY